MAKYGFRRYVKSLLNVSAWMGSSGLKHSAGQIKKMYTEITSPKKSSIVETFEEAVVRLELSEKDIIKTCNTFYWRAFIYMCISCVGIGYFVFLWYTKHYEALLSCLAFCSLIISFCFRESFWYTQMKYRRLGFTFGEWLRAVFK